MFAPKTTDAKVTITATAATATTAADVKKRIIPLLKNAETVSVMLWTADGSEILDYRGNFDDKINWSCYAGNANPDNTVWHTDHDPDGISVHCEGYYYTNDVPVMTYSTLKKIIVCLKETGMRITGKKVLVGATFDVGPEFANSDLISSSF